MIAKVYVWEKKTADAVNSMNFSPLSVNMFISLAGDWVNFSPKYALFPPFYSLFELRASAQQSSPYCYSNQADNRRVYAFEKQDAHSRAAGKNVQRKDDRAISISLLYISQKTTATLTY